MSILGELFKGMVETSAKKTDDIIQAGAKGELPVDETVKKLEPTQPVETVTPGDVPVIDEKKAAEIITEEKPIEMGRPSEKDITQRNINFDNITEDKEVLQIIDNIGQQKDQFVEARGGVVTQKETIEQSSKVELEDILGFKLGEGVTPARITGARIALTDSAANLKTRAKKILDGNATTEEKLAFRQAVSTHVAIQQSVAGMAAEAGRSLNAFRIPVNQGTGKKTAVFRSQLQETFERSGGDDVVLKLAEIVEKADDLTALNKGTRKIHNATAGDMLTEFWINGLLSSPATHSVNITSNLMVALWSIPERAIAGTWRKLYRGEQGVEIEEAIAQTFGLVQGLKDGIRVGWQALKTGEPTDPAMKLEARQYRSITAQNLGINKDSYFAKGIDLFGDIVRLPGRFLGAEDEFFKTLGYRMELNSLAYRKAKSEGLVGEDLSKRIVDLINNPTEELHLDATNWARVQTFTNDLGVTGKKVQQISNSHPVLKFILPFVRTPVNIAKFVGMRSPLALLAKSFRADFVAGGARRDMALAKLSMGSSLMTVGVSLGLDGTITGGGPKNAAQRQALERQGWQPYSIKIGDKFYSFNRADPLGMFLGLSADVADTYRYAEDEQDILDIGLASTAVLAKNITSKTYLSGVSDLMNVISDPDRYAEGFFKRQGASFVPYSALVANIERELDPTVRATYDVIEQAQSRIPGLSKDLPPRRNLWGEPLVLEGGLGWDFVSPFYTKTEKFDFVSKEMFENEMNITMPRRILGQKKYKVELDGEQYDRYVMLTGKELTLPYKNPKTGKSRNLNLHDYLKNVMMTNEYQDATKGPEGGKSFIVKNIVNMFKQVAKEELKNEFPELKDKFDEFELQKITDRTGVPVQELQNKLNMR